MREVQSLLIKFEVWPSCHQLVGPQDWLYDEGEDETKSVYTQKLEELLRLGSPIEQREKEANLRPGASQALTAVAQHYLGLAASNDSQYAHISQDDKAKVRLSSCSGLGLVAQRESFLLSCWRYESVANISDSLGDFWRASVRSRANRSGSDEQGSSDAQQ